LRLGLCIRSTLQFLRLRASAALESRLLLVALFVAYPCGFSATLSIADQTANQGQTVTVPVQFASGGQTVAALQFDLQGDPGLAVQAAQGIISRQGFKVLYSNAQASGVLRCMIVGGNQTPIADGDILDLFITAGVGVFPGTA
jgi:spore coat protein U-like protein